MTNLPDNMADTGCGAEPPYGRRAGGPEPDDGCCLLCLDEGYHTPATFCGYCHDCAVQVLTELYPAALARLKDGAK